ncbi:Similar to S.cerevisiae protein APS3 (Small subunit of the clathrin-associated adaptor complex AP-3) [Malassezia sympodialis ATCC 42132]|uniref:Similar to S.cerevisiae protein APS3 (Small subunit of the clathrin-associated adaptor complex AP-3) n=2 Tax=Malassezia sympodialis (strain ATCC 42132) TaxID=1230383 RepID=A0A1M8A3U5_MALS4|nr:Similar to S.cerevisiae protein APS3 (Small subunit of the clathrin-associated adaptor complex AP-3) [Malassezia sympodialis ATCC 42132]
MTIRAALIINNYGRPRLTKFYSPLATDRQQALIQLIFQLVSQRDDKAVCNFLDAPELTPLLPPASGDAWSKVREQERSHALSEEQSPAADPWISYDETPLAKAGVATRRWRPDDELRVIYRHYATLYFVLVVDQSESELGILDLIQVIVEALDRCFENVCELDLIFHFDEVHAIVDQVIQGGLVLETSIAEIVDANEDVVQARKASSSSSSGAQAALQAAQQASAFLAPSWGHLSLNSLAERGTDAWSALQQLGGHYWPVHSSSSALGRPPMRSAFL